MTGANPAVLPELPHGDSDFVSVRRKRLLYVDKTHHFQHLLASQSPPGQEDSALQNRFMFLARPRQFGKSMLVNTLKAWFQGVPDENDQRPAWLFEGTAGFEDWLQGKMRPVIHLNMSRVVGVSVEEVQALLLFRLKANFAFWGARGVDFAPVVRNYLNLTVPLVDPSVPPSAWLEVLVKALSNHYRMKPVVLVDEYDSPITSLLGNEQADEKARQSILSLLRGFYRTFKNLDPSLHFLFITGITHFGQANLLSVLNNLHDISYAPLYSDLCGFTEDEAQRSFEPHLQFLASRGNPTYAELQGWIQDEYKGYRFAADATAPQVYNPFTLLGSLNDWLLDPKATISRETLPTHWAASGNPRFLLPLLATGQLPERSKTLNVEELQQATNGLEHLDFNRLMFQTGYFTYRGGSQEDPLYLDHPNQEVRRTFLYDLYEVLYRGALPWSARSISLELYKCLLRGDLGGFVTICRPLLTSTPSIQMTTRKRFQVDVYMVISMLFTHFAAEGSELGIRSDLVAVLDDHVCIIEFKFNESIAEGMKQVLENNYIENHKGLNLPIQAWVLNYNPPAALKPREDPLTFSSQSLFVPASG